jgi:hypothetical protein
MAWNVLGGRWAALWAISSLWLPGCIRGQGAYEAQDRTAMSMAVQLNHPSLGPGCLLVMLLEETHFSKPLLLPASGQSTVSTLQLSSGI